MTSFILHLILAFLNIFGAVAVYVIWKKGNFQKNIMGHLFLFYAFFVCYHLSLALPFWIFSGNLTAMAWGYNLAIAFLFLLLAPMYSIMVFQILGVPLVRISFLIKIFLLVGMVAVLIQVYDFRLPEILKSGFIIWNANLISSFIAFSSGASIAVIWTIIFLKNKPGRLNPAEKLKAILCTAGGLMFTISSIYFIARNLTMVVLAFIFVYIGTILLGTAVLIPEKRANLD